MLTDLRKSIKERDTYVAQDVAGSTIKFAGNQASIGEKMSLAGEEDAMKAKIFNLSTLEKDR